MREINVRMVFAQKGAQFLPAIPFRQSEYQEVVASTLKILEYLVIVPVISGYIDLLIALWAAHAIYPLPHRRCSSTEMVNLALDPRLC